MLNREGLPMLTWDDCVGLCDLTEDEIRAIAEHEHIPLMAAVELGHYLVRTKHGAPRISRMIIDDIKSAQAAGDRLEALKLKAVLRHFVEQHRPAPVMAGGCCC
jgi:hypothetical protein